MNSKVHIETPRLILRNFQKSDFEDFWEYISTPGVRPRAGWPAYTDKNKAFEDFKLELKEPLHFAIELKENHKVIGRIKIGELHPKRFPHQHLEPKAKELGYSLSKKYWGKGIMSEAAPPVIKYAFEEKKIPILYASTAEANIGSNRILDDNNFKIIERLPNHHLWINNTKCDSIIHQLTRKEYLNRA